jgi:PAS domain S-box-containing protein
MKPEGDGLAMLSNLLENPKLFRHLVEDLPVGIYIVDQDRRIRFWNRAVERITGYLSHEVVGHQLEDAVQICDRRGNQLIGEYCPVARTLHLRKSQQCTAFSLHKNGHRTAVRIRTRPILEYGDNIGGATVLIEEASAYREPSESPMYGCLDATTGIPSRSLTRAVLNECIAGVEASRHGFGVVRVRILGLEEFRAKHGPQSVVPFLRTAAHTLRHSLGEENFLGCWEEHEFLAVLSSASPAMVAMTAEVLTNLLSHSEVFWWGDRFTIEAEITYTLAAPGKNLETILGELKPPRADCAAKTAAAAGNNEDSGRSRG